jgi:hypothetical protein
MFCLWQAILRIAARSGYLLVFAGLSWNIFRRVSLGRNREDAADVIAALQQKPIEPNGLSRVRL